MYQHVTKTILFHSPSFMIVQYLCPTSKLEESEAKDGRARERAKPKVSSDLKAFFWAEAEITYFQKGPTVFDVGT